MIKIQKINPAHFKNAEHKLKRATNSQEYQEMVRISNLLLSPDPYDSGPTQRSSMRLASSFGGMLIDCDGEYSSLAGGCYPPGTVPGLNRKTYQKLIDSRLGN